MISAHELGGFDAICYDHEILYARNVFNQILHGGRAVQKNRVPFLYKLGRSFADFIFCFFAVCDGNDIIEEIKKITEARLEVEKN